MINQIAVKAVFLAQQNVYRITMTAPLINQARHIAFLIYGQSKAQAVHHVLEDGFDAEKYPAQLIHPRKRRFALVSRRTSRLRFKKTIPMVWEICPPSKEFIIHPIISK